MVRPQCPKKGEIIGLKKGAIKGEKIGLKKGEKKKAIEIAKNLLDVLDTKTIAVKTGLTEEEILKLKQQ